MRLLPLFWLFIFTISSAYSQSPPNYIPLASNPVRYRSCGTLSSPARTGSPIKPFYTPISLDLINKIKKVLPESVPASPMVLSDGDIHFTLECESMMNITFLWEGAGYSNLFGFFTFNFTNYANGTTKANILSEIVVFPEVDMGNPDCLATAPNATSMSYGPFPAGTNIGFYIISNGFNLPFNPKLRSIHRPSWGLSNPDGYSHTSIVTDMEYNTTVIGFEDLINLGDKDYNDVMFSVAFSKNCYNGNNFAQSVNGTLLKCDIGTPVISNYIRYNNIEYALLDNADPNDLTKTCQGVRGKYIPSGWQIANNTATTRDALRCHNWGSECVVLSDGTSIRSGSNGSVCAVNLLSTAKNSGSAQTCYLPTNCTFTSRILIQRPAADNRTFPFCYSFKAVEPVNFVSVGTTRYAVIDGLYPATVNTVQTQPIWYTLPSGWSVVPSTDLLGKKAILMNPWGSTCVVFGDGTGYAPLTGGPCTATVQKSVTTTTQLYFVSSLLNNSTRLLIKKEQTSSSPCCCCGQ